MNTFDVFVYGTLRKGGSNAHYLEEARLLKVAYRLQGFGLYDYHGLYPFMLPAGPGRFVTGEVYRVNESVLQQLNVLEDVAHKLYRLAYLKHEGFYTYLKYEDDPEGMPLIEQGDWLAYINS
jgi:gamma-glutamylcyclotransferase (GGCT)/AIG2-like uncharacterized protein YtfP